MSKRRVCPVSLADAAPSARLLGIEVHVLWNKVEKQTAHVDQSFNGQFFSTTLWAPTKHKGPFFIGSKYRGLNQESSAVAGLPCEKAVVSWRGDDFHGGNAHDGDEDGTRVAVFFLHGVAGKMDTDYGELGSVGIGRRVYDTKIQTKVLEKLASAPFKDQESGRIITDACAVSALYSGRPSNKISPRPNDFRHCFKIEIGTAAASSLLGCIMPALTRSVRKTLSLSKEESHKRRRKHF